MSTNLTTASSHALYLLRSRIGAPKHVQKALEAGVDIICAQGGEGGGHTGDVATGLEEGTVRVAELLNLNTDSLFEWNPVKPSYASGLGCPMKALTPSQLLFAGSGSSVDCFAVVASSGC